MHHHRGLNESLSITVKRVQNGIVSRPLFDHAREGDELVTTGVGGFFTLPDNISTANQLFFLAAGSGIVPIFSLIKTALHLYPGLSVVLIYSNRSRDETIYYNELQALQSQYPSNLQVELLFSLSVDLTMARLNQWLLQYFLLRYATVRKEDILFYTCGPFAYMRMVEIELHTIGFHPAQLRKEQFNTIAPAYKVTPPDTNAHDVEIRINGESHHLTVQYPVTILQAAKRKGIVLPYSCEVGKCGNCAAHCLRGNVWMMYNEVLMNEDIKKGMVLNMQRLPRWRRCDTELLISLHIKFYLCMVPCMIVCFKL